MRNVFKLVSIAFLFIGCSQTPMPKPRGYFRIDMPEKSYQVFSSSCPYEFEYPSYCKVIGPNDKNWITLHFNRFRVNLFVTYFPVQGNLNEIVDESRGLVYKHTIKADAINEIVLDDPQRNIWGMYYQIKGNAATPLNFYLTDKKKHFYRGALYFDAVPNKDSIAPVLDLISKDMDHLIKTFRWK